MKIKLYSKPNKKLDPIIQVLLNRGISADKIENYLYSTDADINPPEAFGHNPMQNAAKTLIKAISEDKSCLVVVDCDADGFTSSAIFINYLHDIFPAWTENKVRFYLHKGKQHGLSDCMEEAEKYDLIVLPDSSSNDYGYHKRLGEKDIQIIILDHHEAPAISNNAITINNQLSGYPNKFLSGAGVAWQFCRFLDGLLKKNNAEQYRDLVALGLN